MRRRIWTCSEDCLGTCQVTLTHELGPAYSSYNQIVYTSTLKGIGLWLYFYSPLCEDEMADFPALSLLSSWRQLRYIYRYLLSLRDTLMKSNVITPLRLRYLIQQLWCAEEAEMSASQPLIDDKMCSC